MDQEIPQNESHMKVILVLLDGSAEAEQSLPVETRLARPTASSLLLARIAPVTSWNAAGSGRLFWAQIYDEAITLERDAAQTYLNTYAERLAEQGLTIETIVSTGDPVVQALAIEADERVRLVVIASHGRTGAAFLALGGAAETLIRKGQRPVLVVHPQQTMDGEAPLERALVPLDGSPLAEEALHIVRQFAGSVFRQVTLLPVLALDTPADEAEEARQALRQSHATFAASLGAAQSEVVDDVAFGGAATQIVEVARCVGDVIVMTTHGRSGFVR